MTKKTNLEEVSFFAKIYQAKENRFNIQFIDKIFLIDSKKHPFVTGDDVELIIRKIKR